MLRKRCYCFSKVCQLNATLTSSALGAITSFCSRGKYCSFTSIRFNLCCALKNYEKLRFNGDGKTKMKSSIQFYLSPFFPSQKCFIFFSEEALNTMRRIWPRQKNVKEECQQTWVERRSTVPSNKSTAVRLLRVLIVRYALCN